MEVELYTWIACLILVHFKTQSPQERISDLARSKRGQWEAREAARRRLEEQQLQQECTFQPQVHHHNVDVGAHSAAGPSSFGSNGGRASSHSPRGAEARRGQANPHARRHSHSQSSQLQSHALSATAIGNANGEAAAEAPASGEIRAVSPLAWDSSLAKAYLRRDSKAVAAAASSMTASGQGVKKSKASTVPAPAPAHPPQPPSNAPPHTALHSKPAAVTAAVSVSTGGAAVPLAVSNRLYEEANRRADARARAKALAEQRALANYTFKPALNNSNNSSGGGPGPGPAPSLSASFGGSASVISGAGDRRPIYERVHDIARAKEEKLAHLRMKVRSSSC